MGSVQGTRAGAGPRTGGDPPSRPDTNRGIDTDRQLRADGGVGWTELTGFQRDLLKAIRRCERAGRIPTGQAIKDHLEDRYDGEINNGRLYQNLGHLVEQDLVEKGFVDGRTNTYSLDRTAAAILDETAHELADICGIDVAAQRS